ARPQHAAGRGRAGSRRVVVTRTTSSAQPELVEGHARTAEAGARGWPSAVSGPARAGGAVRTDWTRGEVAALFELPFTELVFRAAEVHRAHHRAGEVQLCTLLSIKTGGCPEDCGYC